MKILEATGVKGGFVVHIGCGNGRLTAALRVSPRFQVHGLDRTAENVATARQHVISRGVYGEVSIDRLAGDRLPYIDNLANLVVVEDAGVSREEIRRVLAPGGVAYLRQEEKWTKSIKPRSKKIDEWTHFLHDASGNAVAHDEQVGPPRHLQWIGSPRWSRHHDRMASMSAMVSAAGRVFYIMDEGSRVSIQLPAKWKLAARDAFNGAPLWKRDIPTWHSHLWPLKSGPTQLARRLVATGERVYVTLGLNEPLTQLDAVTGSTLRTYEQTKSTEEVLYSGGRLFALVNKDGWPLAKFAPDRNVGDQQRVRAVLWDEKPRSIVALEAETGRVLWKKETKVAPLTLAADTERVLFHDGENVVCLEQKTGDKQWSVPGPRRANITYNFGPRIVIYQDVVLYAGGDRTMKALDAETGKQLWTAPHARGGYESLEDLLVAGGLVWCAPTTRTQDTGLYTGRDPKTGEVKVEFPPNVKTYWFHHRCYMAKATDKFLLPSRTGIEFVDPKSKSWDINHWVRGGCLYGIMPCNGLVYAPPHNCACYPEAKLFGLNALAPASAARKLPEKIGDEGRLERGPAFGKEIPQSEARADQWPTYRRDAARSGFTGAKVPLELKPAWQSELGGKLSSVTIADGKLFVAQVDAHTVHALDVASGQKVWSYTAGGRVDSPPTICLGQVLFGSADGHVYCLRASDGELIWRFRAAPVDRRLMAFEQLESVWPVHGSVLVYEPSEAKMEREILSRIEQWTATNKEGVTKVKDYLADDFKDFFKKAAASGKGAIAYFVAGRSNFLDGGLRFIGLDVRTGRKLVETVVDEREPGTAKNVQERLEVLNMPVGLPDVLSADEKLGHVFMRSQQFDLAGRRADLGPHSGQPAEQGAVQRGATAHLFAPMGFLDDTWFHRSYWVYGRSFAGGHGGYYQAGKYAPSGRILSTDGTRVYGFGRKPQYYRWTTTIEHQLFSADKEAPFVDPKLLRRGAGGTMIEFEKSESLNPAGQPLAVEAWVNAERPEGVVLARGGSTVGYALVLRGGNPRFVTRVGGKIHSVAAKNAGVAGKCTHLVGVLNKEKILIYVNGKLAGSAKSGGLLAGDPVEGLQIGGDSGSTVGQYRGPLAFRGLIDQVRVYHGAMSDEEVGRLYAKPGEAKPKNAKAVLACTFDEADAKDSSGANNHGKLAGAAPAAGKFGGGMRFIGRLSRAGGSHVKPHWTADVPLLVRAMVLADKTLFIAGPPDVLDEESAFNRLRTRDEKIDTHLARQDAALAGKQGGLLQAVSATDGKKLAEYKIESLPTWDGMAAAAGKLFFSTTDGKVVCYAAK